jgi:hypothetical protein
LVIRIYNYMGEEVWVRTFNGTRDKGQGAGNGSAEWVIEPRLRETGIFRLEARAEMVQKGNGTTGNGTTDNRTTGQQDNRQRAR